jgi:hypothetical protein
MGSESQSIIRSAPVLAFHNGLRESGYTEGLDIDLAYRFADGFLDRLATQAQELIRLKPVAVSGSSFPRGPSDESRLRNRSDRVSAA